MSRNTHVYQNSLHVYYLHYMGRRGGVVETRGVVERGDGWWRGDEGEDVKHRRGDGGKDVKHRGGVAAPVSRGR